MITISGTNEDSGCMEEEKKWVHIDYTEDKKNILMKDLEILLKMELK